MHLAMDTEDAKLNILAEAIASHAREQQ